LNDEVESEFMALYVSRRGYGVSCPVTMKFLHSTLLPFVEIIPIGEKDLQAMEKYMIEFDVRPPDSIHLATMDNMGITSIVSEDEEFDAVDGVKRIWLSKDH